MDWLTALAIIAIASGVTISVVVLVAVGSIRRSLNDGTLRQAQQIRRLTDAVASLSLQQQNDHGRIQALAEANRRLSEELSALGERVGDGRAAGGQRLLH